MAKSPIVVDRQCSNITKLGEKKRTLGWGAIWIRFSHHTLFEFPVLIPKCADMRTRYSSNPNRHYGYSMLELSFHPGSWFSVHPSERSSFTVFATFFRLPSFCKASVDTRRQKKIGSNCSERRKISRSCQ